LRGALHPAGRVRSIREKTNLLSIPNCPGGKGGGGLHVIISHICQKKAKNRQGGRRGEGPTMGRDQPVSSPGKTTTLICTSHTPCQSRAHGREARTGYGRWKSCGADGGFSMARMRQISPRGGHLKKKGALFLCFVFGDWPGSNFFVG